jgi:hypothetical protein
VEIVYRCVKCSRLGLGPIYPMICACGGDIRGLGCPSISGTRDQFGIGNEFIDERTNRTIDNWKDWERAGYKDPLEVTKNHRVREMIKDKKKELAGQKFRQPKPEELPV